MKTPSLIIAFAALLFGAIFAIGNGESTAVGAPEISASKTAALKVKSEVVASKKKTNKEPSGIFAATDQEILPPGVTKRG